MPYDVKRFIFSVSLCAILAVSPVLATAPGETESVGTAHTVYDGTKLNKATNGIAGVGYVNRMVDAAGNAATAAEAHAAAAGAHALSAAQSAAEAHEVLKDKVDIDQGADKRNLAIVTDSSGSVYAGYVAPSMIADGGTFDPSGPTPYSGFVLWSDSDGNVSWKTVDDKVLVPGSVTEHKIADGAIYSGHIAAGAIYSGHIADGAIYSGHITAGAIRMGHIADGAVTADKIAADTSGISGVLLTQPIGVTWGQINSQHIADYAVTTDKIADYAVTTDKIASAAITSNKIAAGNVGTSEIANLSVTKSKIAAGAVTIDKTAGVVGMVPVGSADATTYGQFWIE